MAEILLSSEAFVKSQTSVSDNLSGKYILPSLREAQEIGLKGILGDCLLSKLKSLVKDGTIEASANHKYKELIDRCQYYLAYVTVVEVTNKTTFKVGNFGVSKSSDENMQVATQDEVAKMQYYYQSKADACCLDLQNWLMENRSSFPELNECDCRRISSNLYSAATCGIFLGGARGKSKGGCRR
jgi:hypothetical protein